MAHCPRRHPPPRYIRRLPACLRRALGHALDQANPPAIDRTVQHARLSTNPLARICSLRTLLQQMLGLMELGPHVYEQEGPGILYIQFCSAQFKVGHTDCLPYRLEQYCVCQRFGHQIETWVCCPMPNRKLSERVTHLLLNSLGAKAPFSPCPGCGIKHCKFYWYSRVGSRRTILRIVRLAIWLTGGTFGCLGPPRQARGRQPSLHHAVRL
ncbi:hypothetical protein DFH08DRAFT_801796 [Mycena albidolilacea]|uniref:Uncharacterized protein n=1 Tax=Mycena albidolilacea TaxID=1033008 RepID=A0AAD7AG01_9AGAR|nr:hypothetical protein DFH08DRAFT_801796 [Mycena albidolilacea]